MYIYKFIWDDIAYSCLLFILGIKMAINRNHIEVYMIRSTIPSFHDYFNLMYYLVVTN
jgi:hypothetical protein